MDLQLADRIAVITGGSAGIGLAVARGLAAEKVHVVLCARDGARVSEQADKISQDYHIRALGLQADVTRPADIDRVAVQIEREFGGVDILINNAGQGTRETIMDAPDDKWQTYWDLHVMAAVRFTRALVPLMRWRGGGVIVNNASICATQPIYYEPIYNVTKAALVMLTKCLAHELIGENIRVNAVNPGLIQTQAWEDAAREAVARQAVAQQAANTGEQWQAWLDQVAQDKAPIGRFCTPQELADFFVFLCSPRASYCVGSTYYVDGGWLNVVI